MSGVRFTVTKADEADPIGESSTDAPNYEGTDDGGVPQVRIVDSDGKDAGGYVIIPGENKSSNENAPLTAADGNVDTNMALYEEEMMHRPMMARFLRTMAEYDGGVEQNIEQQREEEDSGKKKKKDSKLGTILGVYFPCIQNIFGVILFIRLVWIVGSAGVIEGFFIVLICCITTLLTAISMSAIATNGVVAGGGSYFMISRALGPEFGGAVGVLFYLGTSVASAMYIVGAVEILLNYMAPAMVLPLGGTGDISDPVTAFNNYRVYGTILLIIMFIWVFLGVKFVSMFSPVALFCVILSILSIYIGIFVANPGRGPTVCMVGEVLVTQESIEYHGEAWCTKNTSSSLYHNYCPEAENDTSEVCSDFMASNVNVTRAIPGFSSGVFLENILNSYTYKGDAVGVVGQEGDRSRGEVTADIATSFVILLAIFFPSCTGIMAGSNRSGDLADASRSIPVGTIAAILTTSFVYLSTVILFGATVHPQVLRDKFGESIGGGLIVAELAWPHPWVILIGSFLSTIGAGLQSLTGAPRLLQAIAADNVIPFLNLFSVTTAKGEPLRALLLTALISELGVLVASLDYIAPIITMFFLMCYGFVNLACAVQTLLRTPNWRPRFRFYHWSLSLFGVALCLSLMFISSWYYALIAIAIAAGIYKYIEYKGAEKEWGDGIRGLAMSAARYALMRLEEGPPHVKNWRPQLLILLKPSNDLLPKHRKMLSFANQLKAGKGLTLIGSVLAGDLNTRYADGQALHQTMRKVMKEEKVKGFPDVTISSSISAGISHLVQTSGVGGLRHNTVLLGWPYNWRKEADETSWRVFIDALRDISAVQLACLIPKGIEQFPENNLKISGHIDIWWIVHDGGLLMLLPFLLSQHRVWKNCKMRIFTVAQMEDNSIQMKRDLQTFLYHLRLTADVEVVEMPDSDISAYTYERTLMMEQRNEIVKEMRLKKNALNKLKKRYPQAIVDKAHVERRASTTSTGAASPPSGPSSPVNIQITVDAIPEEEAEGDDKPTQQDIYSVTNQFTFTPGSRAANANGISEKAGGDSLNASNLLSIKPDNRNVRRMHTAVKLNEVIVQKSHDAQLVILNLPGPPKNRNGEQNYMEYLEVLTEGLDRALLVRGGGREVITMYS